MAKKAAKEADKLAKKEAKRLAAIAARAEAKASKVPRAKKAKSDVEVVLKREDAGMSTESPGLNKTPDRVLGAEPPALQEEGCIEVEEIEWKGRSYLLSSDNTVYDDGHNEVGKWNNGQVIFQEV